MQETVLIRIRDAGRPSLGFMRKVGQGLLILLLLAPQVAQGLEEGDAAPDFLLSGSDGKLYSLQGLLKEHSGVVLAFFPRAFTPG
ncbi:MAG: hypothetical protein VX252_11115 [Myxococcota bacterium]|nr:hypothetical protein [Myxococcota bacterium]